MTRLVARAIAFAAWTTVSAVASAQSDVASARSHFQRGVALIDALRWRDAIGELEAARALSATPAVLYNLGLAYRTVGRDRESIETFREFLRASGDDLDADRRAQVQRFIGELVAALARVDVVLEPADAELSVDGARPSSRVLELDPGPHTFVASRPGSRAQIASVTLAPGEHRRLALHLPLFSHVFAPVPHVVARPSPWPWVALGASLAVAAAGATVAAIVLSNPSPVPYSAWGSIHDAVSVRRP